MNNQRYIFKKGDKIFMALSCCFSVIIRLFVSAKAKHLCGNL